MIYQAGTSPRGQNFAATHAECVFVANHSKRTVAQYVEALRGQAVKQGRDPADLKVFSMLAVVTAETDRDARAKFDDYHRYGIREGALALISGWTGLDMSGLRPEDRIENLQSDSIRAIAESLCAKSVGDWADHLLVGGAAPVVVGGPATVVDEMQRWMDETGVDGFNLSYTVLPECVTDFIDLIVPEMQRRGIYKTRYAPGPLRDKLFGRGGRLQSPHPAARHRVGAREA